MPDLEGAPVPTRAARTASLQVKVALLVVSVLGTLLCAELAVRVTDLVNGKGFSSNHRNRVLRIASIRPFRMFGHDLYHDDGDQRWIQSRHFERFSLKKPSGVYRIVCFGGSTTQNSASLNKDGSHYPKVLESKLRAHYQTDAIEVINLGYSAYTTAHSLILLALDVLSWDPDLVILSHNINDLKMVYWPDPTFDYSNKYSNPIYLPSRESHPYWAYLLQHSSLYWYLDERFRWRRWAQFPIQRRSYGGSPESLTSRVFKRNLLSFAQLANSSGIKVVFGSQALDPTEEMFLRVSRGRPHNLVAVYPPHDEFVRHHHAYNETLKNIAADVGAYFVDNDASLGGKSEYFTDFVHYTPAGVERVAESYADALIGFDLIPSPESP